MVNYLRSYVGSVFSCVDSVGVEFHVCHKGIKSYLKYNFRPILDVLKQIEMEYKRNILCTCAHNHNQGPDLYAFIEFIGFIGPDDMNYMCLT